MEKKKNTPLDQLCKGFPDEMAQYIQYCRGIKFEQKPDYDRCKRMFNNAMSNCGYDLDYNYDWTNLHKH